MWINEGLAQWFEGLRPSGKLLVSEEGIPTMERRWRSGGTSLVQRRQDYLVSLALTTRLINRAGLDHLIQALKDLKGVSNIMDLEINRRSIRKWLFSADLPEHPEDTPEIAVERGSDWDKQLAEEMKMLEERGGKVYDFEKYRRKQKGGEETSVTPLPIKDMIENAKKKKKK